MSPQTVQKLQEHSPEFRELRTYLAQELAKINTLDGLETLSHDERAFMASARVVAKQRLEAILAGLLTTEKSTGANPSEYVV